MLVYINQQYRDVLRQLNFGSICNNVDFLRNTKLITVGDETTLTLLRKGIKPYIAVIDGKIKRKKLSKNQIDEITKNFRNQFKMFNPAGYINTEIKYMLKEMFKKGGLLMIEGEEDLIAFPFILSILNKNNFSLCYGHFQRGLICLTDKEKQKVNELIEKHLKELLFLKYL